MWQHSRDCGSGTAVFLIVNSSLILIVRGPRAVIWGSVYLDAHSEEDRELRYVDSVWPLFFIHFYILAFKSSVPYFDAAD